MIDNSGNRNLDAKEIGAVCHMTDLPPDTANEEHGILEEVWIAIGPQGMVAAAVAATAIGSATGWINALWTILAALVGAMLWMAVMKLLIISRPTRYRRSIKRQ